MPDLPPDLFALIEDGEAMAKRDRQRPSKAIEADWRTWLLAVAPRTFTGSFASFHAEFWDWYWRVTRRRIKGETLTDEEQAFLAIWARGFGKSSTVEWAAIAEGARVGQGYVLYVSGTQALAEGHVNSIRERLESEEVTKYYPHLGSPKVGKHGNQYGWRQDFLITQGGWAIRPLGLDVGVRGGRVGDLRPTLIVLDDIDAHDDSPLVVQHKLDTIARSILPAGTKDTIVLGAQNLIHRNSIFNQMVERRTGVLARRIISGPFPAFEGLAIEARQTDHGARDVIVAGRPVWPDIDLDACQKFLDDSGRAAFLAEYQHDFAASEQGRVIPEYDESIHVITWSEFERVFGVRFIPEHWSREVGHDVGFTEGHISAWTFLATSAQNSPYPGLRFRYRGLTFTSVPVDDQAEAVKRACAPDPEVGRFFNELPLVRGWRMSHEALSERQTYRVKHGIPFLPCKSGKTDGIAQWRHYLRVDRTRPHPFREDERGEDGKYRLGCPAWFDIVADDQVLAPRDDAGLRTHRAQTIAWKWRPTQLTDSGLQADMPMKADEDTCFVAGTLIRTAQGEVPIEHVKPGDLIWTRQGLQPCVAAGMTNSAARVVRLVTDDGGELVGTGNHPVWTKKNNFCRLDSLQVGDIISVWQDTKLSSSMEYAFTGILSPSLNQPEDIFSRTATPQKRASDRYTSKSGSLLMGLYRKAARYITRMVTRSITTSPIWNACPLPNTSGTTLPTYQMSYASNVLRDWQRCARWLQSGIEVKRAGGGIRRWLKKQWLSVLSKMEPVSAAVSLLRPSTPLNGSAQLAASNGKRQAGQRNVSIESARLAVKGSMLKRPLSGCTVTRLALSVGTLKYPTSFTRLLVKGVALALKRLVRPSIAQRRARTVQAVSDFVPVYNLSVKDVPEYFANGILVHNCDASRMVAAMWSFSFPLTHDERVEAALHPDWRAGSAPSGNGWQRDGWEMARAIARSKAEKEIKRQYRELDNYWEPAAPLDNVADWSESQ